MALGDSYRAALAELLANGEVLAFVQEAAVDYRPRAEFDTMEIPAGIDHETAWGLVSFVRRMSGVPAVRTQLPFEGSSLCDRAFWTATPRVNACLNDIVARTHAHSTLTLALARYGERREVLQLVVEELAAAAHRDGLTRVDYEAVRSLVLEGRRPENDDERLVYRSWTIFRELSRDALGEITRPVIEDLFGRLVGGVDCSGYVPYDPPHPPDSSIVTHPDPQEALDGIVANYRDYTSWGTSPVLSVIINADMVWEHAPFAACNGLMEVLLRTAAWGMYGLPALCFVPLSHMRLDWERDLTDVRQTPFRCGEALVLSDFGVDSTPYLIQTVEFLKSGVDRLEGLAGKIEQGDCSAKAAIDADGRLNHRQRDILKAMVDEPKLEIDVHDYQMRYDVVTTTARADLNRLVSLRLLLDEFRGRRQVFWVRPDMRENLTRGY